MTARPAARRDVAFPFGADGTGRTASAGYDGHVHDMVELLLFTSPGERVMRPDFGCGLGDLVFEPAGPELAASLQLAVQASLARWLGDVLDVTEVDIAAGEGTISVRLVYTVRATGTVRDDVFTGSVTG